MGQSERWGSWWRTGIYLGQEGGAIATDTECCAGYRTSMRMLRGQE